MVLLENNSIVLPIATAGGIRVVSSSASDFCSRVLLLLAVARCAQLVVVVATKLLLWSFVAPPRTRVPSIKIPNYHTHEKSSSFRRRAIFVGNRNLHFRFSVLPPPPPPSLSH